MSRSRYEVGPDEIRADPFSPGLTLFFLTVLPSLCALVCAASWLADHHVSPGVEQVTFLLAGLAGVIGVCSVGNGSRYLNTLLDHLRGPFPLLVQVVTYPLALLSGVSVVLALVWGSAPWVWLVAPGPVVAGLAVAIGAATVSEP